MKLILSAFILLATLKGTCQHFRTVYESSRGEVVSLTVIVPDEKQDTIRVLIAYADTSALSVRFANGIFIKDSLMKMNNGELTWTFAYSVRHVGRGFYYWGDDGSWQIDVTKNLKYLTIDKKEIPKSWVIIYSLTN